jgi:hypothetical protein
MEPVVRAKLQSLAASDPYLAPTEDSVGPEKRTGVGRFRVREAAARSLNPSDAFSFYVVRTPDSLVCRIQQASEQFLGEPFIGPERQIVIKPTMCSHYDPTGKDSSLCWKIEPVDACSQ